MTPRIPPQSLSKISLKALSLAVILPLRRHLQIHNVCSLMLKKCKYFDLLYASVKNYLPAEITETVLDVVTNVYLTEVSERRLRRGALQLLLNGNCANVTLFYDKEMRDLNYAQLKELKSVNITFERKSSFGKKKSPIFQNFLQNLTSLVSLEMDVLVTEEILETIGIHCKYLKTLEITMTFHDLAQGTGFPRLAFGDHPRRENRNALCQSLQSLDIHGFDKEVSDDIDPIVYYLDECEQGLEGLSVLVEQLQSLKVFNFRFAGHVLSRLHTQNRHFSLDIEEITDTFLDINVVNAVNTLRDIKSIESYDSHKDNQMLTRLTVSNLKSLKLSGSTLSVYLTQYLTNHGFSLETLHVESVTNSFNLAIVADRCPRLTDLVIGSKQCVIPRLGLAFPRLESFTLVSYWTEEALATALRAMPQLKILNLENCAKMRQKHIAYIVTNVPLDNLERINLTNCRYLSMKSVEVMLHNCDKLKYIGDMNDFNCSVTELENAKVQCSQANLDVELVSGEDPGVTSDDSDDNVELAADSLGRGEVTDDSLGSEEDTGDSLGSEEETGDSDGNEELIGDSL